MAARPGYPGRPQCVHLPSVTPRADERGGPAGEQSVSPILIVACARPLSSPALSGIRREAASSARLDEAAVAEALQVLGVGSAVSENKRQQQVERTRAAEPGA